jgi:hypothetical protein
MKKQCLTLGVALVCSVGLATAQSSRKAEPGKPSPPTPKAATVVVTGCVAQSTDGPGYMLNEATMAPRPIANKASDRPVAAPSGDKMVASYMLEGGDMKRHVGHKVEISATVVAENTMAMDHKDIAGTLKVGAVKVIATGCT